MKRFISLWICLVFCCSILIHCAAIKPNCTKAKQVSKQIGVMESHVEIVEKAILSLKSKIESLENLTDSCGDELKEPCPVPKNVTCPPCPLPLITTPCPVVTCPPSVTPKPDITNLPTDCSGYLERGHKKSGIYRILPVHARIDAPFDVFCDMETDGGGWTVFQRRGDYPGETTQNFFVEWDEYKRGFGNISRDFWLGNEKLYALTNQKKMSLRIDMEDFEDNKRHAYYDEFFVDSERALYTATFWKFSGDVNDTLTPYANNSAFSTIDRDNDLLTNGSCSDEHKGGWWYGNCHGANLNGRYLKGTHDTYGDGVNWASFRGYNYSLKFTEMKIRPKNS